MVWTQKQKACCSFFSPFSQMAHKVQRNQLIAPFLNRLTFLSLFSFQSSGFVNNQTQLVTHLSLLEALEILSSKDAFCFSRADDRGTQDHHECHTRLRGFIGLPCLFGAAPSAGWFHGQQCQAVVAFDVCDTML